MIRPGAVIVSCFALACVIAGCNRGRALYDIHAELSKKLDGENAVAIAWDAEQKKYFALPESGREGFQDSFCGKKIRTTIRIKEYKPADMSQFQKAFAAFNYYEKEKFNFDNLMVVIGNGPTYNGIETSIIVFLSNKYLFAFNKGESITVEALIDTVSFTFYNCHMLLYPARVVGK